MSISLSTSMSSARRLAVGAIGAGAVAGAILLPAIPMAQAASVPATAPTAAPGATHVAPVFWGHHRHTNGGFHIF